VRSCPIRREEGWVHALFSGNRLPSNLYITRLQQFPTSHAYQCIQFSNEKGKGRGVDALPRRPPPLQCACLLSPRQTTLLSRVLAINHPTTRLPSPSAYNFAFPFSKPHYPPPTLPSLYHTPSPSQRHTNKKSHPPATI
jgi:hypothetical protein